MTNHLVEVNQYPFSETSLSAVRENAFANNNWPIVYVLSDSKQCKAYIGETTDAITRISTHLKHDEKKRLTTVHVIGSKKFNKSATLDVESRLIRYMAADGKFSLLNGNLGLTDHNYYQKGCLYDRVFKDVWDELRSKGVVESSIEAIDNSDLFKYLPYKSLSFDQRQSLIGIIYGLLNPQVKSLVVQGGAGTGKSILAIFLFKLLHSELDDIGFHEFTDDEAELRKLVIQLKERFPEPKTALVVPMSSFRETLKKAFRNVAGLKPAMVIGPSELAKKQFDIVIVDESHRLRKRQNLGAYYGGFDKVCTALDLDKHSCSEVDWVDQQSDKAVFFYDESQSIKPSDANKADFDRLISAQSTQTQSLLSQFRVRAGKNYVDFLAALLGNSLTEPWKTVSTYDFYLFDSIEELIKAIEEKDDAYGLSRLIAGYSWPWVSKNDASLFDIKIESTELRWNSTSKDWINSPNSVKEIGCIHTTQGYDLNYTGIIFGHEISYDTYRDEIIVTHENYHDKNGKQSIKSPEELKNYILNIYKTVMLRGIRGTFVYACDDALRAYLARYIPTHHSVQKPVPDDVIELVSFENAIPLYDLQAAAGDFSDLQSVEQSDWVQVPDDFVATERHFACTVVGESMNRIIPNGSVCIFRSNPSGSRNGMIVLVEHRNLIDHDSDSNYTVKEYRSTKSENEEGWQHERISLLPRSADESFETIELTEDMSRTYRVIGEFVRVL